MSKSGMPRRVSRSFWRPMKAASGLSRDPGLAHGSALLTLVVDEDGDLVQSINVYEQVDGEHVFRGSAASTLATLRRPTEEEGPEALGLETSFGAAKVRLRSMRFPPSFQSDDSLEGFVLQQSTNGRITSTVARAGDDAESPDAAGLPAGPDFFIFTRIDSV